MISRVADTIYWMNIYIERAENYSRFMEVNFNLSLELPEGVSEQWKPLVETTGDWTLYESIHGKAEKNKVIYFLGFDKENPNSLYNSIIRARENARAIRPEITKELWEQINFLYYLVKEGDSKRIWKKNDPRKFFLEVRKGCQLFYGILDTTISRNDGWHFGRIGQLIERADKTSRVLDVKYHIILPTQDNVGSPLDLIQWTALLKSVSAYDMYRKKNGKLTPLGISEFLILDKEFPRSIIQCLLRAEQSLQKITGLEYGFSNEAEKKLKKLRSKLNYDDIDDIFHAGLHEYLDSFQKELNEVSTAFYNSFFCVENIINQTNNSQQ